MIWTSGEVGRALGLVPSDDRVFTGITTDTRTLAPGTLFVALAGERFDGHRFLAEAAARGATGAVVRRGTPPVPGLALFEVDDPLVALGQLAHHRRRAVPGPVVAVSGNNGKTTTKEMVAAVLRTRYRTHATRANLNNLVGVPLTILEAPDDTEALVIEAGTNMPGETARYRAIIDPGISVVTNATAGHLEGFGTMACLLDETLKLTDGVPLAIVGPEPPELARMARGRARRVVSVGWEDADRTPGPVVLGDLARPAVTFDGRAIQLPLPGRHQAINALFAWLVGEEIGLDRGEMAAALSHVTVPGGRSELAQLGGLTVLNDCYNANPHSFLAAIATAAALREQSGRPLAFVAGSMLELGDDADRLHAEVAAALVRLAPDLLGAVGAMADALEPWAATLGDRLVRAPDAPALGPLLAPRLRGDEIVVLKASRGVALERILPHLTRAPIPPR